MSEMDLPYATAPCVSGMKSSFISDECLSLHSKVKLFFFIGLSFRIRIKFAPRLQRAFRHALHGGWTLRFLPFTVVVVEIAMRHDPGPPILKPSRPINIVRSPRKRRPVRVLFRPSLYSAHRAFVFIMTFALAVAIASASFERPIDATVAAYYRESTYNVQIRPSIMISYRLTVEIALRSRMSSRTTNSSSPLPPIRRFSYPASVNYTRARRMTQSRRLLVA